MNSASYTITHYTQTHSFIMFYFVFHIHPLHTDTHTYIFTCLVFTYFDNIYNNNCVFLVSSICMYKTSLHLQDGHERMWLVAMVTDTTHV